MFPYDLQWRCKVCPDAVGEVADVSAPDGWLMDPSTGRPLYTDGENAGQNVLIIRTRAGAELVRQAVAAGALRVMPLAESTAETADPGDGIRQHNAVPKTRVHPHGDATETRIDCPHSAPPSAEALGVLERMHHDHFPRKTTWPARVVATRILGQPALEVRGYRPWTALRVAGVTRTLRCFIGTWRRVWQGRHRETVPGEAGP